MKPIVGYARRPAPRWPYYAGVFAAILFIFLIIVVVNVLQFRHNQEVLSKPRSSTTSTVTTTLSITSTSLPLPALTITTTTLPKTKEVSGAALQLKSIQFATRMQNNQPVDKVEKLVAGQAGRVYCFSVLESPMVPQNIRHRWLDPKRNVFAEINLVARNHTAYLWSYVNLGGVEAGEWTVEIRDANGHLLGQTSFRLIP